MENFALDRFPPHVLTNIFYFTSAKDLKNIMLVNSSCYEIVTSNSVLHKKFKLTLPENYDYDNTGLEAYKLQIQNSKIVFENISLIFSINVGALDIHTWFFEAYGKKIKMLELHETRLLTSAYRNTAGQPIMQNLFELMPNLEEVHFYCIFAERVHSNFLNPQKRIYPSWKKVKIFIDFGTVRHNFLLELLAYVTSIESFESDGNPPRSFQLLLCRQTNLRELILINDEVNLLQLVKTETPFKLKTFKYSALDKNNVMDTLKKFLENQQDLEELEIKIASLTWKRPLREIMNLPCLKKLKLDFFGSILPAENPFKKYNRTIEHLEIRLECIQSLDNIMDSLANLKSLKLHLMAGFNGQLSEISFEYLTNLRDVSVVFDYGGFVDFPNIRMTQLKSVTLMHHENCYLHSWGKLLKHNPNIDSITFESGDVREIVIEFIAKNFKKLSTFICQNWVHPLNKNAIEILCENCENLYCIELRLRGSEADYAETFKKFEDKLKKITYKWSFIK